MATPCHIIVEGNPAIIFASRGGTPAKVIPILTKFLGKFWQERDSSGETDDTPECLTAQIIVRFGFEICEDDFSNLKVGLKYDTRAEYLYLISDLAGKREVTIWHPSEEYHRNPELGLKACRQLLAEEVLSGKGLVSKA